MLSDVCANSCAPVCCVAGGDALVPSSRRPVWRKAILHFDRYVVCWLHIRRSISRVFNVAFRLFSVLCTHTEAVDFWPTSLEGFQYRATKFYSALSI